MIVRLALIVFAISACCAAAQSARSPNMPATASESPSLTQAIRSSDEKHATDLMLSALQRLLAVRYTTEFQTERFQAAIRKAASDPASAAPFNANEDASYRRLLTLRMATDGISKDIEQAYSDLMSIAVDKASSRSEARKAAYVVNAVNEWIATRAEEDRLQLISLTERLEKARDKAGGAQALQGLGHSIKPLSEFVGMDPKALEQRFRALRSRIEEKAASYAVELESLDIGPGMEFPTPAAPPRRIEPSVGPQGNVFGTEFSVGTFALSFDDGPHATLTQRIIDILSAHHDPVNQANAPATFFRLVDQALALPQVTIATRKAGYPMDNHSWTHAYFNKIGTTALDHEIVESTSVLRTEFGYDFRFFRCPYGICIAPPVPAARERIANQHLIHAYWNIDSTDYDHPGEPQRVADLVIGQMRAARRGLILMHDIHQTTVDALPIVLEWVRAQNEDPQAPFKIRLIELSQAVDEVNAGRRP